MRKAVAGAILGLVSLGGVVAAENRVDLRLACDPARRTSSGAVFCDVTLRNAGPDTLVVPRQPTPFMLPHREPAIIIFEARNQETWKELEIAPLAKRGRYDLGSLSRDSLLTLRNGEIHGWRVDINGDDWLLPERQGKYEVRARLIVHLLPQNSSGSLAPALKEILGQHVNEAKRLVLDGEFISNSLYVEQRAE